MTEFQKIIHLLDEFKIESILIGGFAASIYGSARLTSDIDFVYKRDFENYKKISEALKNHSPYLRGAPKGLPFQFDEITLDRGLNFTLTTDLGYINLLGEILGGNYESLKDFTVIVEVFNTKIKLINLKKLIELKKLSGRPKDFESISELEVLLTSAPD